MANTYSWLITFLIYDNAWYDKEHYGEVGYIPLECQKNSVLAAINSLQIHDRVKIVFIEANINVPEKVLEIWISSKTANAQARATPMPSVKPTKFAMSNSESLKEILKPVIEGNSADRHIVITIGHGSIFGINLYSEKHDLETKPQINKAFIELSSQKTTSRLFPDFLLKKFESNKILAATLLQTRTLVAKIGIADQVNDIVLKDAKWSTKSFTAEVPELNLTVLTVTEINEVFSSLLLSKPVDIFVFDNCLMQNIFTQFELSDKVDFLVAAQSGISYPGFNYAGIIKKICDDIEINTKTIAEDFVNKAMIESHAEFSLFKKDILERWCLNTVDLNKDIYKEIKTHFDNLFENLHQLITNNDKKIRWEIRSIVVKVVNQLFGYNKHSLPKVKIIDLNIFLIFLKETVSENNILSVLQKQQLNSLLDTLSTVTNQIILKPFVNKNFYTPEDNYYLDEDHTDKLGLGFLLPLRKTSERLVDHLYEKLGNTPYTPKFLQNSRYFDFVKCLWDMAPRR